MNVRAKPDTAEQLLEVLSQAQDDLGKGGRRVASFLSANLGASAMLSSSEVAQRCGVNASSVVRLAQTLGFSGYREFQAILQKDLGGPLVINGRSEANAVPPLDAARPLRLNFFADSGQSFNTAGEAAAKDFSAQNPHVEIKAESYVCSVVDPEVFAKRLETVASRSDGVILVAREHPAIIDAVRAITARGVPVVCLTTDLPSSGRTAYVGSDQYSSGATAAWLCGRMMPQDANSRVLFVCSVPFRCQQDREQGFRHTLRTEFPDLVIDEKVSANETSDVIQDAVSRYISKSGPPSAIYSVSGGNLGIARALEEAGLSKKTIFIGHELNANSRSLLERGIMDVAIGHDFDREIAMAVECIKMARQGVQPVNRITQSQVFTRFNCAIF